MEAQACINDRTKATKQNQEIIYKDNNLLFDISISYINYFQYHYTFKLNIVVHPFIL